MRIRGGWMAAVAALGMWSVAGGARAQVGYAMRGDTRPFQQWDSALHQTPRDAGDQGIVWHAGDVRIRPTLGFWVGRDDNVFLAPEARQEDTYLTVAPGVILIYGTEERNYITANYEFENTEYNDLKSEDSESHLFSLGTQLRARGYTLRISDQFRDTTDAIPETGERTDRTENTARASLDRQLTRRTGIEAHGFYETVDYAAAGYIDYDEYSVGADLRHRTWPNTHTTLGLDYGVVDVRGPARLGDADYVVAAAGLNGEPLARTRVQARVGYQWRDFKDPDTEAIEDWVGSVAVSQTFWRDSVAGVRVSRRFFPSLREEGGTRLATDISPYLQQVLVRDRLALALNGTYSTADFYDRAANETRSDDRWQVTGVLDWRALDLLTVGAGYTHERQESDLATREYTRNLAFVRALANY